MAEPQNDERQRLMAALARKADAETAKAVAEAEKLQAETRKAEAEGRKASAEADVANVSSRRSLREEEELLTKDEYHRTYHFTQQVSEQSVNSCMARLDVWRRQKPSGKEPIEVVFTSPGGSIIDGMVLFDYLQMLRREGYQISTGTLGMAASMAGILLQAGDIRWMGKEAWVLVHQASFGAIGSFGAVEDTVKWVEKIQERILDIFATRAVEKTGKPFKAIRAMLKKNWKRRDWWISSNECLQIGMVDEVR